MALFPPFDPDGLRGRRPVRPLPPVPVRAVLPSLITLLALCAGLTSIRMAAEHMYQYAIAFIAIAALLDGIDGRIARFLKSTSRFGAELDSITDFLNFGVAPAVLMYLWALQDLKSLGWIASLIFAICAALRLARFNVALDDPDKPGWKTAFFVGVPAPAGAMIVMLPLYFELVGLPHGVLTAPLVFVYTVAIGLLMVSKLPTWSGKVVGSRMRRDLVAPLFFSGVLVVAFLVSFPFVTMAVLSLAYLGALPLSWRSYQWYLLNGQADRAKPPEAGASEIRGLLVRGAAASLLARLILVAAERCAKGRRTGFGSHQRQHLAQPADPFVDVVDDGLCIIGWAQATLARHDTDIRSNRHPHHPPNVVNERLIVRSDYPRDMVGYGRNPPDPRWPGGALVAVQFVVNYEEGGENNILHGDQASEAFLSEIMGAQPWVGMRHMNMESIYEYGSRSGFWRLWRLFTERGIKPTVFGVATAMARNPDAVAAMLEADWEIASHGLKWIDFRDVSEAEERRQLQEAIRIHAEVTGSRPLGAYIGRSSIHSIPLVAEEGGFLYSADTYADDLPYWIDRSAGKFLIVPYTLDANDMRFATAQGFNTGDQFFAYLRDAFDCLYAEGLAGAPKMMSVGLHCRLVGRPGRAAALARFLDYVAGRDRGLAAAAPRHRPPLARQPPAGVGDNTREPRAAACQPLRAARSFAALASITARSSIFPEWGFNGVAANRGMTWKWRWKTLCPAALSLNCMTLTPSAANAALAARATFWTAARSGVRTAGSASSRLREGALGTTSACPVACGITSMNTTTWASS